MLRYLFALIPGILLFSVWYFVKSDEVNFFLRFVGRLSFVYLTLAFAVTPIMELTKKHGIAPYRRVFGVLAFLLAMAHGAIYFDMEYTYQNTFFVWEHFKELDILSGIIAFIIMAALGITSNDFSVRLLGSAWKKIQILAYPLYFLVILHVAFAGRFDGFYMVVIGLLVFLRTIAYLSVKTHSVGSSSAKSTRYRCVPCGWIYDEKYGDPDGGIAPGTRFEDIPDDWRCPVCGVTKEDFIPYEDSYEEENTPATVVAVTFLNPTTLELTIETAKPFTVIPGQFARVVLKDHDGVFYRSYSVVGNHDTKLTFCIRLLSGRGGNVLKNLKMGDVLAVEGIYGSFVLQDTDASKVFIATGTGLSPIVSMMRSIPEKEKILLFGVENSKSLFYTEILEKIPKLKKYLFLSREEVPGFIHGRIDCATFEFPKESEFYLCGNPQMVEKAITDLRSRGFEKIYHEKF